jgi:hypothetical protein
MLTARRATVRTEHRYVVPCGCNWWIAGVACGTADREVNACSAFVHSPFRHWYSQSLVLQTRRRLRRLREPQEHAIAQRGEDADAVEVAQAHQLEG